MNEKSQQISTYKKYRLLYKKEGLKGFIKKAGWPVTIGLFMFFLVKGLIYLAIFYGGFEWIKRVFL
jgi:hypothetical protein